MTRLGAFLSNPRSGTNTVREVLGLGPNRDHDDTDSPVIHENHCRYVELARRHDLTGLFVFGFVRHPAERARSWFDFHRQLEPYRELDFDGWVAAGLPHHWHEQNGTRWLEEGLNPLLQAHFVPAEGIDFVGRHERFDDDLRAVVAELDRRAEARGLSHRFRFRAMRLNASRLPGAREPIRPDTAARLRELLAEDYARFGYE